VPFDSQEAAVLFIADSTTLTSPEHPALVVDLLTGRPPFGCVPTQLWSVENNLNIANMDWEDFAGSAAAAPAQGTSADQGPRVRAAAPGAAGPTGRRGSAARISRHSGVTLGHQDSLAQGPRTLNPIAFRILHDHQIGSPRHPAPLRPQ
jgi:hypothetical protein